MKNSDPKVHKNHLMRLIKSRRQNEALQYISKHAGLSLEEAKGWYKHLLTDSSAANGLFADTKEEQANSVHTQAKALGLDNQTFIETRKLLRKGDKLRAIKMLKENSTLSLQRAKQLAEQSDIWESANAAPLAQNASENEAKAHERKSSRTSQPKDEIIFQKNRNREAHKRKKVRSESGCLLTLIFFAVIGGSLLAGILGVM